MHPSISHKVCKAFFSALNMYMMLTLSAGYRSNVDTVIFVVWVLTYDTKCSVFQTKINTIGNLALSKFH